MRKLDNYIARTVIGAVAMVLLVLVALDAISALVDQLGEIKGSYDFNEALIYVCLTLPERIYSNLPFSALVGSLIGLGILAGSSELVVMRAAGISVNRITWSVLQPALLFILLGIGLGEFVIPVSEQMADSRRAIAQGDSRALGSRHGLWSREDNEFLHINAVLPNGRLYGVTRFRFDTEGHLQVSSFAQSAIFQGDHWREEEVQESVLAKDSVTSNRYTSRRWESDLSPQILSVLILDPETLSIRDLRSYARFLQQQGLESSKYLLTFWKKMLQPLATISLVLIAVSFVFGPLRQVTMGFRIFTGVIVGIVFQTSQDMLGPASLVYGFPPLVAVIIPIMLCIVIGVVLLRRAG